MADYLGWAIGVALLLFVLYKAFVVGYDQGFDEKAAEHQVRVLALRRQALAWEGLAGCLQIVSQITALEDSPAHGEVKAIWVRSLSTVSDLYERSVALDRSVSLLPGSRSASGARPAKEPEVPASLLSETLNEKLTRLEAGWRRVTSIGNEGSAYHRRRQRGALSPLDVYMGEIIDALSTWIVHSRDS